MSETALKDLVIVQDFNYTPKQVVEELDKDIVGQAEAKKKVAIALRNRWRRKQVPENLRDEIMPKNILMIGPTGVGKTEIGRRTAKLVNAPFIKIEATKFTEIGYVGRDVDSIIRDLLEVGINLVKKEVRKKVKEQAEDIAAKKILKALIGDGASEDTANKFQAMLDKGSIDDKEVEIEIADTGGSSPFASFDLPGMPGSSMGVLNISDMIGKAFTQEKKKKVKMTIKEAKEVLTREESDNLIDEEKMIRQAIKLVENDGIVFLDEIDKIAARSEVRGEVNREGVQRDLLPLIEGTIVNTKYGPVNTDHILFIASGAFHMAKPSDLLPELQGRLPIRVELSPLSVDDLVKILTEPKSSLIKQYEALLETEGVKISFDSSAIREIAELAAEVNRNVENIGARRLHTILEKLLEEISFTASDKKKGFALKIDKKYVNDMMGDLTKQTDLSKFIL
jgi:ATP-dependent HslUV protease ATP-binding subunit HslU